MPTHGDYPWERDARRREERSLRRPDPPVRRSPRRRSGAREAVAPILLVALLALGGFAVTSRSEQAPDAGAASAPPAPPVRDLLRKRPPRTRAATRAQPYRLSGIHSRWRGRDVIEVWGRTTAPDGTTIRVSVTSGGTRRRLALAPAAARRFYVRERVPPELRGRSLSLSIGIVR